MRGRGNIFAEIQRFRKERNAVGNAQSVVHFKAVVGLFPMYDTVSAVLRVAVSIILFYVVNFRRNRAVGGRIIYLVYEAGCDCFKRRGIRLITIFAFVVIRIRKPRVTTEIFVSVGGRRLYIPGDIHRLYNAVAVIVPGKLFRDIRDVSAARGMSHRAETLAVYIIVFIGVSINVLNEIIQSVCAYGGRNHASVFFITGKSCSALTTGVYNEHHRAATGIFYRVLRHGRARPRKAGHYEHYRSGIFLARGFGLVFGDGIRKRGALYNPTYAVKFLRVVFHGHFLRKSKIFYLNPERRSFKKHCGKTGKQHRTNADYGNYKTFFLKKRFFRFYRRFRRGFVGGRLFRNYLFFIREVFEKTYRI